jgi:calcineurin-like phosphoesterase family protein
MEGMSPQRQVWFSSDSHLFHNNIIKYCNRPFLSVEEMNNALVDNWNSVVGEKDIVYYLGDLGMADTNSIMSLLNKLKGSEIHFIRGNHDKKHGREIKDFFSSYSDYKEIEVEGQHIVLSHYPFLTWNKAFYGSYMLHGHCHGTLPKDMNSYRIDVGVDCWNYFPVSFQQIKQEMSTRKNIPPDQGKDL